MRTSWLKAYIIQVIPVISFFVYIIGFTYYLAYYYYFGINIISFITLQEVLVSTFIPIMLLILLSLMYYAGTIFTRNASRNFKLAVKRMMIKFAPGKNKCIKRFLRPREASYTHLMNLVASPLGFVAFAMGIPYYLYTGRIDMQHKYAAILFSMLLSSLFIRIYMNEYTRLKFSIQRFCYNAFAISVVAIATMVTTISVAYNEAKKTESENCTEFCVTTEDKSEYTDMTYTYIGDCCNAVFLYNREERTTLVLNMEHIIGIVYKDRQNSVYTDIIKDLAETADNLRLR